MAMNRHGSFIWYELITAEPDAAAAFYGEVLGWSSRDSPTPGKDYRIFSIHGVDVAGHLTMPKDAAAAGMQPGWLGYIGVEDVDATVAAIKAAGGAVHMGPIDLPVGRLAMVADPQGASFYVMRGNSAEPSRAHSPTLSGHGSWHELTSRDSEAAFAFYSKLFGWQKSDVFPMGELGNYQIFADSSSTAIGGMMNAHAARPRPAWGYYFNVDDAAAAVERVRRNGGEVTHGPAEVPGGSIIVNAVDPGGAPFAFVSPAKSTK